MKKLQSYLGGRWCDSAGKRVALMNPATEAVIAETASGTAPDFAAALAFARDTGGPTLRALTFAERGELCRALSKLLFAHRDELIELAIANGGNTRSDAKFDIDGASGTLAAYADLGAKLGATKLIVDGEAAQLTRSVRFVGQHVWVSRQGVAVHINAFNFPAWNLCEKLACAILAGTPVITKPATATALVAHRLIELIVEAKIMPEGALSLIIGSVSDLFDHLHGQDGIAFTGSADTGRAIRSHANLIARSVRINIEADSLNATVLGADVERGSETYNYFLSDVARELTQKAGQKCTATRRIMVPMALMDAVKEDLAERLSRIKVGNPELQEVTMGPVATKQQYDDVRAGIALLTKEAESVFGGDGSCAPIGSEKGKGYFVGPVLLCAKDAARAEAVHHHEVFGPVATLLSYETTAQAIALVVRGEGSLVTSVYADDRTFLTELALGIAPFNGRLLLGSEKIAGQAMGPGTVLPQLLHGGPGRAGGGQELGGARGLEFYMQRTAIAGDKPILDAILK